jgi:hypothetical protein
MILNFSLLKVKSQEICNNYDDMYSIVSSVLSDLFSDDFYFESFLEYKKRFFVYIDTSENQIDPQKLLDSYFVNRKRISDTICLVLYDSESLFNLLDIRYLSNSIDTQERELLIMVVEQKSPLIINKTIGTDKMMVLPFQSRRNSAVRGAIMFSKIQFNEQRNKGCLLVGYVGNGSSFHEIVFIQKRCGVWRIYKTINYGYS